MKGEKWWQSLHYNIATMPWFDSSISTTSSHFVNLEFQSSIRLFDLKNKQTNWYDLSIHLKLFLQCYFMNTCGVKRVTSPSSLLCSFRSVSWYNVDEWHDWQVAVEYLKCNSELCEHHKCNFVDFYYLSVATEVSEKHTKLKTGGHGHIPLVVRQKTCLLLFGNCMSTM